MVNKRERKLLIRDKIAELKANHGTRKEDVEAIWNAAINQAVKMVRKEHDDMGFMEPWITPEDIEKLYT